MARENPRDRRPPLVRNPAALADELDGHVPELAPPHLDEDPHTVEVGLVLEDVARRRHGRTTPSARRALRSWCGAMSLAGA